MDVYWLEQTDHEVPAGDQWLSGSERARLDGLHIPKRHADWRLGRWTAKCAVAAYLNLPDDWEALCAVELRPATSGAPEVVVHGRPADVVLSLSHSGGIGLCAIAPAGAEVGCDVETVQSRSAAFAVDYFTGQEQEWLAQTPVSRRDQALTLLWSAKESALKALRCGLRLDTRSVNVAPAGFMETCAEKWRPVSVTHIGGKVYCGWWRESNGRVYTVAAAPRPLRLAALQPRTRKLEDCPEVSLRCETVWCAY